MLKKIAKKNCPGPPPLEQIFFPLGYQREKTSFGGPREEKSSSRGLKKGSFYFLWSPKGCFFHLVPQRKFFYLWYPKGKKLAQEVEDRGKFFYFFGNFFQHVKKLPNFWDVVNIKMAKSKLYQLGFYWKIRIFW